MDGSAMKLTFNGCCRGGRGGRPRDKAATVPSAITDTCLFDGNWMVDAGDDAAWSAALNVSIGPISSNDAGIGRVDVVIAAWSPCSDDGGTLLRGTFDVSRDEETMLLDPDRTGLPGLKSEPIPAPGPYLFELRSALGERDGRLSLCLFDTDVVGRPGDEIAIDRLSDGCVTLPCGD